MLEGSKGIVYLTAIEENAIAQFDPHSQKTMIVVQDKRLQWPDTMAWGQDGKLYVTTSQIHRIPKYHGGCHQITFIPAKILTVDKQADKHRVIVWILLRKYRGSFDTLMFGENKPLIGSCHDGHLDLIYHRDPGLEEGQPFPLWTIQ